MRRYFKTINRAAYILLIGGFVFFTGLFDKMNWSNTSALSHTKEGGLFSLFGPYTALADFPHTDTTGDSTGSGGGSGSSSSDCSCSDGSSSGGGGDGSGDGCSDGSSA